MAEFNYNPATSKKNTCSQSSNLLKALHPVTTADKQKTSLTLSQLSTYKAHLSCLGHKICSNHLIFIKPSMHPSCFMSSEAIYQILFSSFEYKYLNNSFPFHDFFAKYLQSTYKVHISCLGHNVLYNPLVLPQISQFDIVSNNISHPNNINLHIRAYDKHQCLGIVRSQTRSSGDVLSLSSV
jgi:hypothetical protein